MLDCLFKNMMVIDVETSGNDPNEFSLISLGAVYKGDEFYIEFAPDKLGWDKKCESVHGLKRNNLMSHGSSYKEGFQRFYQWMKNVGGFNAFGRYSKNKIPAVFCDPYDMIWIDVYLRRYTGMNPIRNHFRDIRTLLSVLEDKLFFNLPKAGAGNLKYTHNALDDSKYQFACLKAYVKSLE